jgi:hypothetical protein
MSFTASTNFLGTPDFKIIDINPQEIAKALQNYLDRGSKLTGVSLDDIKTAIPGDIANYRAVTLVQLLEAGMKIFDALVWLSAGRPASHPITRDPASTSESILSLHEVARAVFYNYFFILTQARYPVRSTTIEKPKVPNFLSVVMGMQGDQSVYVDRVCSFEPEKFDKKWVQSVKFSGLGQETVSRFGLGVAGYRMFGPFKLYRPEKSYNNELQAAVDFAVMISKSAPTWDIHPATRDATILTKRGNLNKNLGNLILDVFTDEQITEMVNTKVLYKRPEREPSARNYYSWSTIDDISGTTLIFRT